MPNRASITKSQPLLFSYVILSIIISFSLTWPGVWPKTIKEWVLALTGWWSLMFSPTRDKFTRLEQKHQKHPLDSNNKPQVCFFSSSVLRIKCSSFRSPFLQSYLMCQTLRAWCFMNTDSYEQNVIQQVLPKPGWHLMKTFLCRTVKNVYTLLHTVQVHCRWHISATWYRASLNTIHSEKNIKKTLLPGC